MEKVNEGWDSCLSEALKNTTVGAGVGFLAGLFLLKRKTALMWYGGGLGTGYSYVLCEAKFQDLFARANLR